ncbi:MAG: hypothetical protein RBU29_15960, partial [bacterium]|nr:hypothetical protein [bacterium]
MHLLWMWGFRTRLSLYCEYTVSLLGIGRVYPCSSYRRRVLHEPTENTRHSTGQVLLPPHRNKNESLLSLSLSLSLCLLIGMIGIGDLAWGKTTDVYPKPVSEYAEQTGPGQMTFLAYPKYYRNANNELTEVNTTLSVSSDPDWDYEVTSGIWSLSVHKDGTFQARHAGDAFTYQFDSLGVDRGSEFQPLDLGKANFSQMAVAGDTVTWQNVVAGVDLKVRYIHDILKVDVVVKKETMGRIKTSAQRG